MNKDKLYKNEQITYTCKAPSRITAQQPQTYKLFILFGILFSLLFLFLNDKILIIGTWAIVFVLYVFFTIPAQIIEHKITQFGVYWYDSFVPFDALYGFSIKDNAIVFLLSPDGYSQFSLILPDEPVVRDTIVRYLRERLPLIDSVPVTSLERVSGIISRLFGIRSLK